MKQLDSDLRETDKVDRNRAALLEAVDILDERKREVVSLDGNAWMILCHAKFYLLGIER